MSNLIIDNNGTKRWFNGEGKLHRIDGPALEGCGGDKHWYVNGKRHRLDGPAFEDVSGTKEWWDNDRLHRLDGPAIEQHDGDKFWYVDYRQLSGPLDLLEYGTKLEDIAEWLTPREIANVRDSKC